MLFLFWGDRFFIIYTDFPVGVLLKAILICGVLQILLPTLWFGVFAP